MPHAAYTMFMLLALAAFWAVRRAQPAPTPAPQLHWKKRALIAWAMLVGAAAGAKLPFLAQGDWLGDGKTVLTGIAGAYLAVEIAKFLAGIEAKTGDGVALPLAVSLAIGRWGCFFNGCCFGTRTSLPWSCDFGDGVPRHPTQIYESLFHAAMAIVLIWLARRDLLRWQRLKLYLIAYCAFRFATEFIRPEPRILGGLTWYQWFTLPMAGALAVQWRLDQRRLNGEVQSPLAAPQPALTP
jgi:phosphatidylglycerol:prolipoprotein diacylglycerol transferase